MFWNDWYLGFNFFAVKYETELQKKEPSVWYNSLVLIFSIALVCLRKYCFRKKKNNKTNIFKKKQG